eukprot:CAMPEP_0170572656 /NCGR_PEP_ID=MMETSP0224-20130122/2333_1 /TAXON_ID=285029 /ORGANISM="Togula jolla, Strain CCCM 725" /LENGTH=75 /DNA_ID=CAMNT_0010895161 /DNA_START=36 /DNA_END=263 /DNA_ORIENTATION=+
MPLPVPPRGGASRGNRSPKVVLALAALGAVATVTYAVCSRSFDKERMFRGVTFDVERMRQKRPEGLAGAVQPPAE